MAFQAEGPLMATEELKALEEQALADLAQATDEAKLREWNTKYFGDKGLVKAALGKLATIPKELKAVYGAGVNKLKTLLTEKYETALKEFKERALQASLTSNPLDVTLPGRPRARG